MLSSCDTQVDPSRGYVLRISDSPTVSLGDGDEVATTNRHMHAELVQDPFYENRKDASRVMPHGHLYRGDVDVVRWQRRST